MRVARVTKAAVFGVVALCSIAIASRQQGPSSQRDFQAYYAAGLLVRHHQGAHLYDRPDPKLDPVMRVTSPETPMGKAAEAAGTGPVVTYIYPPLLAEMIAPLSLLSEPRAAFAWRVGNTLMVAGCAWLLGRLQGLRLRGLSFLFLGLLLFTPVAESISWGQIGVLLLLCWSLGIVFYAKGYHGASALALALATAIKLTPLLVIFPMLLWGEWKWLRWYAIGIAACAATMLIPGGAGPLVAYFGRELPAMSAGLGTLQNKSIPSALQLIALAHRGLDVASLGALAWDNDSGPARPAVAAWVVLLGRAVCAGALGVALWLIARLGRRVAGEDRSLVLAAMAALSIALSPVAWRHSYAVAAPLLVLLWIDVFRREVGPWEFALLAMFSLEVSSFSVEQHAHWLVHGPALGAFAGLVPLLTLALVLFQLRRLRRDGWPSSHRNRLQVSEQTTTA